MQNVTTKIEGKKLIITCDLEQTGRPSSTGKTLLVATTGAAMPIPYGKREGLKLALNLTAPVNVAG